MTIKMNKKERQEKYDQAVKIKYGGMVDHEVDVFVENGCVGSFDFYKVLRQADLDNHIVLSIAEDYKPDVQEIEEVLQEYPGRPRSMMPEESYYGGYTHSQVERLGSFFKSIIRDCENWVANKSKMKKQKTIKIPSILRNFKYKTEDDELKIASINPKSILKAKVMVGIGCGNRKDLIILKSASDAGFSIDRSTITNVDYEQSCRKTITTGKKMKEVQEVIDEVQKGGKRVVNKLLKIDKWKPVANTDIARINSQVVILKAIK